MSYDPLTTTSPQYSGPIIVDNPLHTYGVTGHLFATQRYGVQSESYVAPTLNDTRTVLATTLYCVGDTKPNMDEAGTVFYERQWCNVPSTWYDYTTFSATFPGIAFGATEDRRIPFTREVSAQVENAYYLVGTGGSYASADLIPIVQATAFQYSYDTQPRDASDFFLGTTTTPTLSTWSTAITTAAFSYVVQASTLERYAGNIWVRKTIRVRPL